MRYSVLEYMLSIKHYIVIILAVVMVFVLIGEALAYRFKWKKWPKQMVLSRLVLTCYMLATSGPPYFSLEALSFTFLILGVVLGVHYLIYTANQQALKDYYEGRERKVYNDWAKPDPE